MAIVAYSISVPKTRTAFTADDALVTSILKRLNSSSSSETEVGAESIYFMSIADPLLLSRPVSQQIIQTAKTALSVKARRWIVLALSSMNPDSVQAAALAGSDSSPMIRGAFVGFVAPLWTDAASAIPYIIAGLGDDSQLVRYSASMGLSSLIYNGNAANLLMPFWSEIQSAYMRMSDPGTRCNLLDLFVSISPEKAEPIVREALNSQDLHLRGEAISHLGYYAKSADMETLRLSVLSGDAFTAQAAMNAILQMGEQRTTEALKQSVIDRMRLAQPESILLAEKFRLGLRWRGCQRRSPLRTLQFALLIAWPI